MFTNFYLYNFYFYNHYSIYFAISFKLDKNQIYIKKKILIWFFKKKSGFYPLKKYQVKT